MEEEAHTRELLHPAKYSLSIIPANNNYILGHVNKISCFSSFCLQKFGEGGGYLLFIFRGQRSYATIFTGVKLGYKRSVKGKTGTTQVKKEQKNGSMDVRMLELSFIFTIANESVM